MQDGSPMQSATHGPGANRRGRWTALCRNQRGATMVEFALVAVPFFVLLYGAFEISFIYWANQELENASSHGARLIRTGQAQAGAMTQAQLKTEICSRTAVLVGCATKLRVDVRSATTFAGIVPPSPLDGSGGLKNDSAFSFSPGVAHDVVLVSAFYNWKPLMKSSDYILRAASVSRNEPF